MSSDKKPAAKETERKEMILSEVVKIPRQLISETQKDAARRIAASTKAAIGWDLVWNR